MFMGGILAALFLLEYGYVLLRAMVGIFWRARRKSQIQYSFGCAILFAAFTSCTVFLHRHELMGFAWKWIIPFIGLGSCVVAACAFCGCRILAGEANI